MPLCNYFANSVFITTFYHERKITLKVAHIATQPKNCSIFIVTPKMRHHDLNFALDMEEKCFKYLCWWFDEFMGSAQVPHFLELFPELKTRLMK